MNKKIIDSIVFILIVVIVILTFNYSIEMLVEKKLIGIVFLLSGLLNIHLIHTIGIISNKINEAIDELNKYEDKSYTDSNLVKRVSDKIDELSKNIINKNEYTISKKQDFDKDIRFKNKRDGENK